MKMRRNSVLILLVLVVFGINGCRSARKDRGELAAGPVTGDQWLVMSPLQQNDAIYGYIQGYLDGVNQACSKVDSLFETNIAHRFRYHNSPSTFPSDRCRESADQYSKMTISVNQSGYDYGVYTKVITEFYLKHPEYRKIQSVILMHHLTDQEFKSADELYTLAKRGDIGPI
jgi:hypothetical protein